MAKVDPRPLIRTRDDVLERYPRLVAHMVCESLGYFTPESAAMALLGHILERSTACEWYLYIQGLSGRPLLEVGREIVARSFKRRHSHRGYMAEYAVAKALVDRVRVGGSGPLFGCWF